MFNSAKKVRFLVIAGVFFTHIIVIHAAQEGIASENPQASGYVTSTRMWRCPDCGKLLLKGMLGEQWHAGDLANKIEGQGTCASCGAKFLQSDIYGGKYDIQEKATIGIAKEHPQKVSVLVFQLMTSSSPPNPLEICLNLLHNRYSSSDMNNYYIVGRYDSITMDEALAQYRECLKDGQLPDLGGQFDAITTKDMTGTDVVVLFFK